MARLRTWTVRSPAISSLWFFEKDDLYKPTEFGVSGHSQESLVYSLGVVLFFMLSAKLPFYECPVEEETVEFEGKVWGGVSGETKSLVEKLLSFNANERSKLEEVQIFCRKYFG